MRPRTAFDWFVAILVLIGVVASIPMIPLVIIAWVGLISRSSGAGLGMAVTASRAFRNTDRGELFGISSRILFPMVAAGWFLIALLSGGLIGERALALAWVVGLGLFIVPTLLIYRAMHPELASVPFDEWLGSVRPGPVGIAILTWIAAVAFVVSLSIWTTSIGRWWMTVGTVAFFVALFISPFVALAIARWRPRLLYRFLAVATVFSLVTIVASFAGLTPNPPSP